jgi:hypothetical protein
MKYLDAYVLTEDQKEEITNAWRKMNRAGLYVSIDAIAQMVQGNTFKWIFSEDRPCPSCENHKSKTK